MGGENMQIKRATTGIHDHYRGVFLNRGVFVKAPPGFFSSYPSDFEAPPHGYEKLNVTLREIKSWDPKTGLLAPPKPKMAMEVPPPEGPMVGLAVGVAPATSEPVAASDNAQPSTPPLPKAAVTGTDPAMSSSPAGDRQKPKAAKGRTVKIK